MPRFSDGPTGSIAKLPPPTTGTKKLYFDDHKNSPTGFGMRVTAKGQRVFILRYSADGRRRLKTIGEWPVWTLDAARIEAQVTLRDLAAGSDPLEEKRLRRDEHTIADLATEWLSKYATGLKSERYIRSAMTNDLVPAIGHLKVSDVRRRDVIAVLEAKAETAPRSAALLLQYSRKMLDFATDRDYTAANCLAGLKPSAIAVQGKRNALAPVVRSRVLDDDEIRSFWTNADHANLHPLTVCALRLVLVTGQRPGEIAGMHVSEIDGNIWTIPADRRGKTNTAHKVYLTNLAMQIIEQATREKNRLTQRRAKLSGGYLFEARPGAPITNGTLSKAITRAAVPLGIKTVEPHGNWTPHDLRRTMRTALSACKIRPDISELTIGHTKKGVLATYDLHSFNAERKHALEQWEKRLLRIIGGDADHTGDNVTSLEAKA
jgi:integrase